MLLLPALAGACAAPLQRGSEAVLEQLVVGMRVVVEGEPSAAGASAERVSERAATPDDKPDKAELVAPVEVVHDPTWRMLGRELQVGDKAEFEDERRRAVQPYTPGAGEWLKLKLRLKDDGTLQARTVRRHEPQRRFELDGAITAIDAARGVLQVAGIPLQVDAATRYQLGDGDASDPLALFFDDEQKSVPFTIPLGETVRLGGEFFLESLRDRDLDLRTERQRDRTSVNLEGKLDFLWQLPWRGSFALVEGKAVRDTQVRAGVEDVADRGRLSRAFTYLRVADDLRVVVGRQDFDEEREWLYDEVLDGALVRWTAAPFDVEGWAAMGRELFEADSVTSRTQTYAGLVRWHIDPDHWLTAYALQRKDAKPDNFEPFQWGLRSYGKPWRGLAHWVELARADGYVGRTPIDGYAADVGLSYRFEASLRPTLTAAYAYASGKRAGSGEVGFRQSGLQDNNAKFGGVTSFRYYGEVFDPELSNLEVLTLGLGVRPAASTSLDLLWHHYRQGVASTALASSDLRTTPNGTDRSLGWEADLVFGQRFQRRVTLEVVFGHFEPGDAFDFRNAASKLGVQMRVKF